MALVNRAASFARNFSFLTPRQVICSCGQFTSSSNSTSKQNQTSPKTYQHSFNTYRHIHLARLSNFVNGSDEKKWKRRRLVPALSLGGAAAITTDGATVADTLAKATATAAVEYIPPPPVPPPPAEIVPEHVLNALGEPTFQSLGLAHWTPPGMIQSALEHLHVDLGLPWWGAIVCGTLVLRLLVSPLVVKSQKNAANMHNNLPTMTRLQERFTEARKSGNLMESAKASNELMDYMKRNGVNPLKNFLVPMAQVPIFISVFVGLRKMANLPVESLKTGGFLWLPDLTVCDPYYILPAFTMLSFLATIELGADGVAANQQGQLIRMGLRVMPFVIFPLIMNFPGALLVYWATSNAFSLTQVGILKIPVIRDALGIPRKIKHPVLEKKDKKSFVQGIKETMNNSKKMAEVEDRARLDAVRFKQAGMGPLVKTYKTDPTKKKKT